MWSGGAGKSMARGLLLLLFYYFHFETTFGELVIFGVVNILLYFIRIYNISLYGRLVAFLSMLCLH